MKEMKQRRKKERTWAEAARLVLENYSDAPMTPKQILQVIESEGLKEMSGTSPLACLNAMLHSNSRGGDGLFYKLPGRISLFTLKKDALQWSRNPPVPEGEELEDTADAESCGSNEASTVSGDNDVSLDETSSNASCSTESQSKGPAAARESHRAASQTAKQKKKTGVMLPRVVLTPLKVNGAHMESASGLTGRHADGESSSTSSSSSSSLALCKATLRSRAEINRDPPQLLRGIRKPTAGQMKRNRGEDIDFETPGSILVNTNLRALINSRTFNALPSHFQQQLLYLLPEVDRQVGADGLMRLSSSALNNEFFTHAAQSWRERLADGEFTHEMQVRIRQEMEKEKRVEQWKEKFFEDYYGQKLGLTQEESQEQNLVQEDAENRTGLSAKGEARPARGPAARQRDGRFRRRSRADLRCRARRSLYRLREPEQTEPAKEPAPVEPDSSLHKEPKPEVDLKKDALVSPSAAVVKPEGSELHHSPETSKLHSTSEDRLLAAANRIPGLPQENSAQEPKDQKRKCFEEAASASFPEKKPRLEDRQSFRNTIESVHPEKPQPTKEEPKVPPIRIQLSRIKPPWVVKGQPTYQICPRIISSTEPSSRGRAGARTLADIKARALQARAQREAAAIGGGGGPGGGRSTDAGGGGGGSRSRAEHRRSRRSRGKRSSDLQRAQLLPPLHLSGEKPNSEVAAQEANTNPLLSSREDPLSSKREGSGGVERATGTRPGEAQPGRGCPGRQIREAWTGLSLDSTTCERQQESPEQLLCEPRTEAPPCSAPQERQNPKLKHVAPPVNGLSCSQGRGAAVSPTGEGSVLQDVCAPTVQLDYPSDIKEDSSSCPALLPELSSVGKEQHHEPEMVMSFRFNGSETFVEKRVADGGNSKAASSGVESMVSALCNCSHPWAESTSGNKPGPEELDAESLVKPSSHNDFVSQNRMDAAEKLPLREECPRTAPESAQQASKETGELKAKWDEEVQSTHSGTTDTASDFEGDGAGESVEMDLCFRSVGCREVAGKDSSCHSSSERCGRIRSKSPVEPGSLAPGGDFPAVSAVGAAPPWAPRAPSPPRPERPMGPARPVSSVETNNLLVMQLLKGNLPLQEVLPVSHTNIKLEIAQPGLDKQPEGLSLQMERGSSCYFGKGSSLDVGIKTSALSRSNDFHVVRSSKDPQGTMCGSGAALPSTGDAEGQSIPEKHSKVGLTLSCQDQLATVASASQKPEDVGPQERTFSSCSFEEQKELSKVHRVPQHKPVTSVITNKSPEKLKTSTEPQFVSPAVTALGPNQTGGSSVNKTYGAQGKKLFGSGFPHNPSVRLHHSRALDLVSALGTLSPSKQVPLNKSRAPGEGMPAAREEWTSKQHVGTLGGIKTEKVLACASLAKSNAENRQDAAPGPAEQSQALQGVPLLGDLPFFKFSREPGKGHNHPLEPSSIPSQLNIKQAFYGKLSKLQLNSTSFNYSSNTPAFPRSLAGSMMQLTHKANFAASHNSSLSVQMFADGSSVDEISFKCSCSLKAMIMCKGCGAFCHDDCIGPSKLCVLCLVVR